MITKNKKSIKHNILNVIAILTAAIPYALSCTMFIGLNPYSFIITLLILSVYFTKTDIKKIMPVFVAFLLVMFFSSAFGNTAALVSLLTVTLISAIYIFLPERFKIRNNAVTAGFSLATALTVTVLLTTYYFGIGASGNNVREMIASYLSLGFHPNWRGVLYGTIVMVIMLTFPRKFKKFCTTVKAPFIAIVVTLILNCFLNPSDMPTAISEIGNFSLNSVSSSLGLFGRIPIHSLAVVMIVGAWESVEWKKIKIAFSSVTSVVFFVLSLVSTLFFGYVYGILISAILYIIYKTAFQNLSKLKSNIF